MIPEVIKNIKNIALRIYIKTFFRLISPVVLSLISFFKIFDKTTFFHYITIQGYFEHSKINTW